jgi:uncharacterized DUF497 family protein
MTIHDLAWRDEVEDKIIRKHGIWPAEVEQALANRPHVRFMERGHRPGEHLYAAFGQTDAGRYLAVYFILKPKNVALIVTARDMTTREIRTYGKGK